MKSLNRNLTLNLLALSAICHLPFAIPARAQTNELILPPNAPTVLGPIYTAINFLSQGTNWMVTPFAIYDTGTRSPGGGIAAILKTGDYVNPVLRLDYLASSRTLYMPSGNATFQYPISIGKLTLLPFGFVGAAIPIAGRQKDNGGLLAMYGVGLALRTPWTNSAWYIPKDIVWDWEHWGGFAGEQYRFGLNWKF